MSLNPPKGISLVSLFYRTTPNYANLFYCPPPPRQQRSTPSYRTLCPAGASISSALCFGIFLGDSFCWVAEMSQQLLSHVLTVNWILRCRRSGSQLAHPHTRLVEDIRSVRDSLDFADGLYTHLSRKPSIPSAWFNIQPSFGTSPKDPDQLIPVNVQKESHISRLDLIQSIQSPRHIPEQVAPDALCFGVIITEHYEASFKRIHLVSLMCLRSRSFHRKVHRAVRGCYRTARVHSSR